MVTIPPAKYRKRRKPLRHRGVQPTPIPGPILISATYNNVGLTVTLIFDRAIDIAGLNGNFIYVNDGTINLQRYRAVGAVEQLAPDVVRIGLGVTGGLVPDVLMLNALAGNGILAQSDGTEWAGADVDLPF